MITEKLTAPLFFLSQTDHTKAWKEMLSSYYELNTI